MFGILAALTSISTERSGRQALDQENYVRTGQGLPRTRIYRESSEEKRTRKELAQERSRQRLVQQVKLVRLMKKLLQQIDASENDKEFDEMAEKVRQLELKVIRIAEQKNFNAEVMLDLAQPDDDDDRQLEQIVRQASTRLPDTENCKKESTAESFRDILLAASPNSSDQSQGDPMNSQADQTKSESLLLTSQLPDCGDNHLIARARKHTSVSS